MKTTQSAPSIWDYYASKFTLIELLIVIAIIAILAGMLLPALNKARETARNVYCINQQKSIWTAASGYQDAYNEWIVPCRQDYKNYYGKHWLFALSGVPESGSPGFGLRWSRNPKSYKNFICPTRDRSVDYDNDECFALTHYSINFPLSGVINADGTESAGQKCHKMSCVKYPSKAMLFGETTNKRAEYFISSFFMLSFPHGAKDPRPWNVTAKVEPYFKGRSNFAMFDGHVTTMTVRDFYNQTTNLNYTSDWNVQFQVGFDY